MESIAEMKIRPNRRNAQDPANGTGTPGHPNHSERTAVRGPKASVLNKAVLIDRSQVKSKTAKVTARPAGLIPSGVRPLKIRHRKDGSQYIDGDEASFVKTFGTSDPDLSARLALQAASTLPYTLPGDHNYILAALQAIGPKDALEGLVAVQMVAVHHLAMAFLARTAAEGQASEMLDANLNRATKLLRTFIGQMDGLHRHRGKIIQSIVVGDVNVADGGQAIVGPVNHSSSGKAAKDNAK